MRYAVLSLTALAIAFAGCRTTGGGGLAASEAKGWGSPEEVQSVQKAFVGAIIQCSPMILALVPGSNKIDLGDASNRPVVEQFVARMTADPKSPFEPSARLAKYYQSDKAAGPQAPCGGEAIEYLIFNFAGRTTLLAMKSNPKAELKILY